MTGKRKNWVIALPYLWLLIFFLLPFLIVLKISFADIAISIPPYTPTFDFSQPIESLKNLWAGSDFENYTYLTTDSLYVNAYLSSLKIATISTLITLLIGFPIAYGIARAKDSIRPLLLMLVILPFWTSFLIRVYAWIGILKTEGLLNKFLLSIGLISDPLTIFNTEIAVYIGIVYSYLPFMILPIYATLERMDDTLLEAAIDLGCSRLSAFWSVTAPLAKPGIIAGSMLVFIPAMGEFVIPDLLGGSTTLMIGKTLWIEFFSNRDWPLASAVAIILLLLLVLPILLFQRYAEAQQEAEAR